MFATAKDPAKEICFSAKQCWEIQKLPQAFVWDGNQTFQWIKSIWWGKDSFCLINGWKAWFTFFFFSWGYGERLGWGGRNNSSCHLHDLSNALCFLMFIATSRFKLYLKVLFWGRKRGINVMSIYSWSSLRENHGRFIAEVEEDTGVDHKYIYCQCWFTLTQDLALHLHPGRFNSSEWNLVFLYLGYCICGCDFTRSNTAQLCPLQTPWLNLPWGV